MKKVKGVIIKDSKKDKYFAFVKQYPGICAQADNIKDVKEKIDTYFKSYVSRVMSRGVEMDTEITSI